MQTQQVVATSAVETRQRWQLTMRIVNWALQSPVQRPQTTMAESAYLMVQHSMDRDIAPPGVQEQIRGWQRRWWDSHRPKVSLPREKVHDRASLLQQSYRERDTLRMLWMMRGHYDQYHQRFHDLDQEIWSLISHLAKQYYLGTTGCLQRYSLLPFSERVQRTITQQYRPDGLHLSINAGMSPAEVRFSWIKQRLSVEGRREAPFREWVIQAKPELRQWEKCEHLQLVQVDGAWSLWTQRIVKQDSDHHTVYWEVKWLVSWNALKTNAGTATVLVSPRIETVADALDWVVGTRLASHIRAERVYAIPANPGYWWVGTSDDAWDLGEYPQQMMPSDGAMGDALPLEQMMAVLPYLDHHHVLQEPRRPTLRTPFPEWVQGVRYIPAKRQSRRMRVIEEPTSPTP